MKGNPALRTVLVLLVLAAVFYPITRVISHDEHPATAPTSTPASPTRQPDSLTGTLRIRTAPAPLRLKVTASGKTVLEAAETNGHGEFTKELSLASGSDLLVRAEWADDRPHALHAEFLPTGTKAPIAKDYWSERTLEDVLSLP